ncbi:hypothetical protein [Galactobacter sp.]|uniref:hypothetical protein n=1 Tax=Galactobacter sp. TaxID=2676125 RepID=UPI0025BA0698|nr:hypothetical protein [Galactobacter sp.]
MTVTADQLNAGHAGSHATIECDSFGASGVIRSVFANWFSKTVVIHLYADGCTATVQVPHNADVKLDSDATSGIWLDGEEVAS